MEVYMDDYIVVATPKIQDQLHHVANAIMTGIHDVFFPDKYDKEYAISLKKILKKDAVWETIKNMLGFEFDGNLGEHTTCLTEDRHTYILIKLKSGLGKESIEKGVPHLKNFEPIFAKLRYSFITIPAGKRVLSPLLGREDRKSVQVMLLITWT